MVLKGMKMSLMYGTLGDLTEKLETYGNETKMNLSDCMTAKEKNKDNQETIKN